MSDVGSVGLVGETQAQRAIEVEDWQPDAVDDQSQAMLALAPLQLDALGAVDVGVGREHAADFAARPFVGVVVDPDPEGVALGAGELALEAHPLAGQSGLDVGVIELVELAPLDFDDLAAQDLLLRLTGPVEKGS